MTTESAAERRDRRETLISVFAWTANVSTSVVIIFVIKALLSVYKFTFATTVSGLHFLVCAWAVWGIEKAGMAEPADMPIRHALMFAVVGALSIAFANLSLLLNSVGFYQIAKLLMSPFVASVEMLWLKKRFPWPVLLCILLVLAGVAIVTVSDVTVQPAGVIVAACFVVMGGMQQILCGHLQALCKLQSHQLMSNTAFLQGMILLITGPFVDKLASGKWLMEWEASVPGIEMLLLSCAVAIAVNASQFMVLGRFSATSFQVLGHAKTLMVLLGGWLLFDEPVNGRKLFGMSLAFLGMVSYGGLSMRYANQAKAAAAAAAAAAAPLPAAIATATAADPATGTSSHTHVYSVGKGGELREPLLSQHAGSGGGGGAGQAGFASPRAEDTQERSNEALLRALGDEEKGERAAPARGRGAGGGVGLEWLTGMFAGKPRAHKVS